ncbi:MAG: aldehyde dehydrogenase family protein, partial [Acidobacteriia bacterium]|nr:aldehyde dehydrogenase family protein [Terriglobia bacterium]
MVADKDLQSIQEVRTKVAAAHEAFLQFRKHTQEEVDRIVDQAAAVARANAESLAKLAVEEPGYGNVRDKTIKNLLNSDLLHRAIRPMKTVGVIGEDPDKGILEIAEPAGVVAAILPTTNPTSTAFFKILIALKSKNAIVVSPHPRAVNC